jgi:hypothetical protein
MALNMHRVACACGNGGTRLIVIRVGMPHGGNDACRHRRFNQRQRARHLRGDRKNADPSFSGS